MILGFRDKDTERLWRGEAVRSLPVHIQILARRKLRMLDAAACLDDLRIPPANRLHALKGNRTGCYSIRINDQWRICFAWNGGRCTEVEIVDYH